MALDVQLVLLEPRNVQLLTRCATLELARNVCLVVTDDPEPRISSAMGYETTKAKGSTYLVIIPVVLTPSVL